MQAPIPGEVKARVKAELTALPDRMKAAGFDYSCVHVSLVDSLEEWKNLLKTGPVDIVCIAAGLRKFDDLKLIGLMERLIAAVQECAPQAKIVFNTSAADTLEAAQRALPAVK